MDHSAPMLANFEALPEILTAGELETELRAAGFRMVHFSTMDCGHAIGIAER